MNFSGLSKPNIELLITSAPEMVWEKAEREADRSPMIRFKAGCVIYDPVDEEIISSGCSHPDITYSKAMASVHAESHALRRTGRKNVEGCWAVIYTLNGRGGSAYTSRPCYSCAQLLYKFEIERVVYAHRIGNDEWTVITEHPEELIARAPKPTGLFARHQRIPNS